MIVSISSDAEVDIREGHCFYEQQNDGLVLCQSLKLG